MESGERNLFSLEDNFFVITPENAAGVRTRLFGWAIAGGGIGTDAADLEGREPLTDGEGVSFFSCVAPFNDGERLHRLEANNKQLEKARSASDRKAERLSERLEDSKIEVKASRAEQKKLQS